MLTTHIWDHTLRDLLHQDVVTERYDGQTREDQYAWQFVIGPCRSRLAVRTLVVVNGPNECCPSASTFRRKRDPKFSITIPEQALPRSEDFNLKCSPTLGRNSGCLAFG
jgi:hypothetical protein